VQQLRPDQPTPLYYQLEIALRRAMEAGQFPDGRLPTEEDLAKQYQVSRLTVRSALRRLEEDGLIERRRARGTFVCREALAKLVREHGRFGFEEDLRRHGGTLTTELLSIEEIESPSFVAASLGLPANESVYRVRRLGRVNGEPLFLVRHYYPLEIGAKLVEQDLTDGSSSQLLAKLLGVRITSARMRIDAAVANAREARHLQVRKGHPLLVTHVTSYDAAGRPLQLMRAAFRGDRYAIAMTLPARAAAGRDMWTGDGPEHELLDRLASWELIGVD
jgi:GntR family transcriptional regulator